MMRTFLSALGLLFLSLGPAHAQQLLGDSEIREMLVGRSALFADYSVATYGTDGTYTYIAANNLVFRGKYTLSGGKLCLAIDRVPPRCDAVGMDGLGMYLVTTAGLQLRFTIRSAMAPQTATTLCEVQVAYTIYPPAAGVPENVRAFSGTWIGKWDYGLCAALIVESVQPNGVASLVYVNGSFGGEAPIRAGSSRFFGTIVGNKLTDGGKSVSLEFVMNNRNELSVKRYSTVGINNAKLSRQ